MSRRYGRNQKRRYRDRIAELESEVQRVWVLAHTISAQRDRLSRKLKEQEAHVKEIAETINDIVDHSALLPPTSSPRNLDASFQPERLRLVARRLGSPVVADADVWDLSEFDLGILEINLWNLRVLVENHVERFRKIVHVNVPDNKDIAYWISDAAWAHFAGGGKLPELAREIYSQIVGELTRFAASDNHKKMAQESWISAEPWT